VKMQCIANLARKTGKDKKMANSNVQLAINQLNQEIYHEKKKIQKTLYHSCVLKKIVQNKMKK